MIQYKLTDQLFCMRRYLFAGNNLYADFQGHNYLQYQSLSTLCHFYFLLFYSCVFLKVLSESRLPATDYTAHPQWKVGEGSLQWQVLICGWNSPLNWAMLLLLTNTWWNPGINLPLCRVSFPPVMSSTYFLLIILRFWVIYTNCSFQILIMEILQTQKISQSFLLQLFFF